MNKEKLSLILKLMYGAETFKDQAVMKQFAEAFINGEVDVEIIVNEDGTKQLGSFSVVHSGENK